MMNSCAISERKGSTLSLAIVIGGTVAGLFSGATAATTKIVSVGVDSISRAIWSNSTGSTHSAVFGLLHDSCLTTAQVLESAYKTSEARKDAIVQSAHNSVWQYNVFNPAAPVDVDSLTETADSALDFVAAFGPTSIRLTGLNPAQVQGEHLATLLRVLSTWRNEIPGWHDALLVDSAALERAGIDPKDALFGMI